MRIKGDHIIVTIRLPYHYINRYINIYNYINIYFYSARREEAGSYRASYATHREQRGSAVSLLPAGQSGYTTQNGEAQGNNAMTPVSRVNSSHSTLAPHRRHIAVITGANKSLTGFGWGTMRQPC